MDNKFVEFFNKVKNSKKGKQMSEFIGKLNIDNENNDYIDNYINYWILLKCGFKKNEIDKLWMQEECLKKYYDTSYADTIFSVFIPLKKSIQLVKEDTYHKNIKDLITIKKNKDTWFCKNRELYEKLNDFAKEACTIGNVINYPYVKNEVNFNRHRGFEYNDLFLHTLEECFEDGKFSVLFSNYSNYKTVEEWIYKNKLEKLFFRETMIKKDNIIKIGIQDKTNTSWNNIIEIEDMKNILNEYTKIIHKRTTYMLN